jgi:hypothetical protein
MVNHGIPTMQGINGVAVNRGVLGLKTQDRLRYLVKLSPSIKYETCNYHQEIQEEA